MTDGSSPKALKQVLSAKEPQWLLRRAEQTLGPVPELMLLKAALFGGVDEAALVRPVGQSEWRTLRTYPRLTRALSQLREKLAEAASTSSAGVEPLQRAPVQASGAEQPESERSSVPPVSGTRARRLSPPPRPLARLAAR